MKLNLLEDALSDVGQSVRCVGMCMCILKHRRRCLL